MNRSDRLALVDQDDPALPVAALRGADGFHAILGRLLAPYALKLAGLCAIIGAVTAILLGARQAGRNAERVEVDPGTWTGS